MGNRLYAWNTMPISRLLAGTPLTSWPPTDTVPDVASSRPARIRNAVVFPHPDGPSSATSSPGCDVQGEAVERLHASIHPGQVVEFDGNAVSIMHR